VILFDSSLHHFSGFERILPAVRGFLDEGGLLVLNEFVGPHRFQWPDDQLRAANTALAAIPEKYRTRLSGHVKQKVFRPGLLRMILSDPSEAIQSSKIVSAANGFFTRLIEVGLGGNIIHLALKDIAHHFTGFDPAADVVLRQVFAAEDDYLQTNDSDFLFGIYR